MAANRHYIEEYSRQKKLTPSINDIIQSSEFLEFLLNLIVFGLSDIVDELDIADDSLEEIEINERDLRHRLCELKLWNPEGTLLRFPSKLNKLVPHWVVQDKVTESELSNESSETAYLTYF